MIANFPICYSERFAAQNISPPPYFGRDRLWEILELVTEEENDETRTRQEAELVINGVRWGARKVNVSSEGVYVVTTQKKNLYEKVGFQLMNEGNVVPSV